MTDRHRGEDDHNIDYLFKRKCAEYQGYSPYKVDIADRFGMPGPDSYYTLCTEKDLGVAIAKAKDHGVEGLVYDCHGCLVWSGLVERDLKEALESDLHGIRRICEAIDFAGKAHQGQCRKGTKIPYINHPLGAAQTLLFHDCSPEVIVAAVLHDTVEDTEVELSEIEKKFGSVVASIVRAVSEPDKKDSWENRKQHTIESLKNAPTNVLLVALADKYNNIGSTWCDLQKEGESFWSWFNRPKEQQKWYYTSLAKAVSDRKDSEAVIKLVKDFTDTVREVFGD